MDQKKVLERLERLCARAEHCSADIRRKALKALEGDEAAASQVVEKLIKEKYVDDARYAAAFVREKSALTGWGPVKIRYALRAKGIPAPVVDEALKEAEGDASQDRLEKLLQAKYRSLKGDPACKLKLLRFGLGRGYTYDQVSTVVEDIFLSC